MLTGRSLRGNLSPQFGNPGELYADSVMTMIHPRHFSQLIMSRRNPNSTVGKLSPDLNAYFSDGK